MKREAVFGWSGPRPDGRTDPRPWTVSDPKFLSDQFDRPRRASPWAGHRWFAYDLIRYLQPKCIVELGTHYGCSYWAFCQAVSELDLETEVIAVDTWEGDPHAGFYDDVYELVEKWLHEHFATVPARLIRATFDDAVKDFESGTVDLLHIDGYHSYEAAAHDHATWMHTLTSDATVLFHDVDPASGYGSARYWSELAEREGGWTFDHNFGLGVLTRNQELATILSSEAFRQLALVYPARAAADLAAMQVEDMTDMIHERQALIDSQDALIADRDAAIAAQAKLVEAKQDIIEHQEFLIADRDEAIAAQTALIDGKQAIIDQQSRLIADRDERLREQAAVIDEQQSTIGYLKSPFWVRLRSKRNS